MSEISCQMGNGNFEFADKDCVRPDCGGQSDITVTLDRGGDRG